MSTPSLLLPFQPASMSTAQLSAVSFLARYSGRTRHRGLHGVAAGLPRPAMPIIVPVLRLLEACGGERTSGPRVRWPLTGNPIRADQPRHCCFSSPVARKPQPAAFTAPDSRRSRQPGDEVRGQPQANPHIEQLTAGAGRGNAQDGVPPEDADSPSASHSAQDGQYIAVECRAAL
jgi:hypothetical protein